MATTAFWPVKGSLKAVIDYADNPDKTTNPKYLDDDLAQVLRYAERDDKTDQRLFVSGVNCTPERAYEEMKAIQIRFGMRGTNVAYHGYQSFLPDEITPGQAHQIGIETAKRMWGDQYQVVVTTHLNTTSIHNHLVLNAVSFKDGRKFQNHICDHIHLREVSDQLCRERGLSVLEDSSFYKTESRGEYWAHHRGVTTHRDMLKQDIEACLQYAMTHKQLIGELEAMGYTYDWERSSIKAPGWERAIRLERLGYSYEVIHARVAQNLDSPSGYYEWNTYHIRAPKRFPLLELEKQIVKQMERSDCLPEVMIDLVFLIIITLLQLAQEERDAQALGRLLSPSLRAEMRNLEEIKADYALLTDQDIHTVKDLSMFAEIKEAQIKALEQERQQCRNQLRRPKAPEVEAGLKQRIHDISDRLKPMRKDLKAAKRISLRYPEFVKQLDTERQMEAHALQLARNRERAR